MISIFPHGNGKKTVSKKRGDEGNGKHGKKAARESA
jgi:hypothetical protein